MKTTRSEDTRLPAICPYTGLRSFTEEESLYFKGRDQQIDKISALLEQNKFLMVTGASGEGKSSLIYAGLVPNARAGFFKAKYSNWIVTDFRPERSPVKNMARALAGKFNLDPQSIETELRRGYSSLIDLYTNSEFYQEESDLSWQSLSEPDKKEKRRNSANLLILVDQFEEFFTNPENFYKEAPSQDSQIVVNLLLETVRIALKRNLPIYIVCTMRSDYIGQCTAFRGLPEYIGFSQFFVPRLKRKDLKQVIEEPAILSGNRITQRLVERLVFDLAEGLDQLPILQHALSQIWLAADHGYEEMDLIHYAQVGGMPAVELPDADQENFKRWLARLPDEKKAYYTNPGLHKIIEIHANSLYESAWEYHNEADPDHPITRQEAKKIIALTFACLTKIDHSRAVRNRMTLEEITAIINIPGIQTATVGNVLNIFREEENAFIRPFKSGETDTHILHPDSVLDITHESLIRNWNKLIQWANQEFEFYTTYLDFKKQLDRWMVSKKDTGYLLPIGPLTYFENWYIKCKPNAGWIRRYEEVQEDKQQALQQAQILLGNAQSFLKRSAARVRFTRAFMKYGPRRVAVFTAIVALIGLSGFYWYDAGRKQNDQVIKSIRKQANQLMNSTEIGDNIKANHLIIDERYAPGSMLPYLATLEQKSRLTTSLEIYKLLVELDKKGKFELKTGLLNFIENNLDSITTGSLEPSFALTEINAFAHLLAYDNYYQPRPESEQKLKHVVDLGYSIALNYFNGTYPFQSNLASELNLTTQLWLSFGTTTPDKIRALVQTLSPFESEKARLIFSTYYPKGSYEMNGRIANDFNGGYHTLASLYAAQGDASRVLTCFEFLKQAGQNDYFTGSLFNNYTHILEIFYQFGFRERAKGMVDWLGNNFETNTPLTIYRNSVIRAGYLSFLYRINIEKGIMRSNRGYFFPNLCLADRDIFNALCEDYEILISRIPNPNERHYLTALQAKRRAMYTHKWDFDRGFPSDTTLLNTWLGKSVEHFQRIDSGYLEGKIPSTIPYYGDGIRNRQVSRRQLLIYPDYMDGWFSWTYHSDLFFNYLVNHNLFEVYYRNAADLDMVHLWIAKANEKKPFSFLGSFDNNFPLSDAVYKSILRVVDRHPDGPQFDHNLIHLILANNAFSRKDTAEGMHYYSLFNPGTFPRSLNRYEYLEKTYLLNQVKDLAVHLAEMGKPGLAVMQTELFDKLHEKGLAYLFMTERLYAKNADPYAFVYLDSTLTKLKALDFSAISVPLDIRYRLIQVLGRIGSQKINQKALSIFREIPEVNKPNALFSLIQGVTEEGNYYRAVSSIPSRLTETEDLLCRSLILWAAARQKETPDQAATWAAMERNKDQDFQYVFYYPN